MSRIKSEKIRLVISSKYTHSNKEAIIKLLWETDVGIMSRETIDSKKYRITASGAVVAGERGFLLGLELTPENCDLVVDINSTHVPLRFKEIWKAKTLETDEIMAKAVKTARERGIVILSFENNYGKKKYTS